MALSEQDKQKIKDSVIASCITKGLKPTTMVNGIAVPNPLYANCVQLGYDDAIKNAQKGSLGQWFSKVNSFVQQQGGITGLLQNASSIANQYRGQTPDINTGTTQFPPQYGEGANDDETENNKMGLWIILIILLVVLIIASIIYFNKQK